MIEVRQVQEILDKASETCNGDDRSVFQYHKSKLPEYYKGGINYYVFVLETLRDMFRERGVPLRLIVTLDCLLIPFRGGCSHGN